MNDAKNIYSVEQNADVSVRAVPALSSVAPKSKKSIFARIVGLLCGPDLDLATFERLEGISRPRERDVAQRWRDAGGRF